MTMHRASRPPILNAADIEVIAQGASTLPGNWYLDPVIDLRRRGKPRVWVRKHGAAASDILAVSFERLGTLIWVSIQSPKMSRSGVSHGLPFDTFQAAFVYLWTRLVAIAAGSHTSAQGSLAKASPLTSDGD